MLNPSAMLRVLYLVSGIVIYVLAILTTFGRVLWSHSILGPEIGPIVMIMTTTMAGLVVAFLGYLLVTFFGGPPSLDLARFLCHITGSKQVVEFQRSNSTHVFLGKVHWVYLPGIVFISAIALGWDLFNADSPKLGAFQPIVHALDFFYRQPGESPILISGHMLPALVVVTVLASLVPALVIPYFSEFKITGINAWPFHRWWLSTTVLTLAGLSVLLTLGGLIYRALWLNRAPLPYHFVILVTLGFSMHLSLGLNIGESKAQTKIKREISRSQSGRLLVLS